MKRFTACLLALCMLCAAASTAMADALETYNEILRLREEIAALEQQLAALEQEYATMNSDRLLVFEQESYLLPDGNRIKVVPEIIRVTDDAPKYTKLRWTSSDRSVASVDRETGLVTAGSLGTTTITCYAEDDENVQASVTVQVVRPVRSIEMDNKIITLTVHRRDGEVIADSFQLTVVVKPDNAFDRSVTWKSSDESIVTVDENGVVTAVGHGETHVVATAKDGSGVRASAKIYVEQGVEHITLSETAVSLYEGETMRLDATVEPEEAQNRSVVWSSSDEQVAQVSKCGVITAVNAGSCVITATAEDGTGTAASCEVTVKAYVAELKPAEAELYLRQGESTVCTVAVQPLDATNKTLSFTSSDEGIATVSESGMITAVGAGRTTVIVRATDGSRTQATVPVYVEPEIPLVLDDIAVGYSLHGMPEVTPVLSNLSFATDVTAFSFAVRCNDAYGNPLMIGGADGEPGDFTQVFTWSEGTIKPGETFGQEEDAWFAGISGADMAYEIEVWLTEVTAADGTVFRIPLGETMKHHKY